MSGNRLFLDTNIVLYLLSGDETLSTFLNKKQLYISVITELELLAYGNITEKEEEIIKQFISECIVVPISSKVKEETIQIRKKYNCKLPDSIIIASSICLETPLISSDQAFDKVKELSLIQYER